MIFSPSAFASVDERIAFFVDSFNPKCAAAFSSSDFIFCKVSQCLALFFVGFASRSSAMRACSDLHAKTATVLLKKIRPAAASVKKFRRFQGSRKRFRCWSSSCGIEMTDRFLHRKNSPLQTCWFLLDNALWECYFNPTDLFCLTI